jgi:hypothetical protein
MLLLAALSAEQGWTAIYHIAGAVADQVAAGDLLGCCTGGNDSLAHCCGVL